MDQGYVKLYRKIRNGDLMQNHHALILWVWMLTTANWEATSICPKCSRVDLDPGQLLYGRVSTAKATFMSVQNTRTAFAYLHKTKRVTSKSTNKGTIVTIVNWASYQGPIDGSQPAKQPTGNQHLTSASPAPNHSVEGKKGKNGKKKKEYSPEFEMAWEAYGHKGDKGDAVKPFDEAVKIITGRDHAPADPIQWVIERTATFATLHDARNEKKFRKDYPRWLKGKGYDFNEAAMREPEGAPGGQSSKPLAERMRENEVARD